MHILRVEATFDEVMRAFATTQRSRIPVYRGTDDHILGFVHIKDICGCCWIANAALEEDLAPAAVRFASRLARSADRSGNQAGQRIARRIAHATLGMAVVVDEFGSIFGL